MSDEKIIALFSSLVVVNKMIDTLNEWAAKSENGLSFSFNGIQIDDKKTDKDKNVFVLMLEITDLSNSRPKVLVGEPCSYCGHGEYFDIIGSDKIGIYSMRSRGQTRGYVIRI